MLLSFVDANSHWGRIRLEAARAQYLENFFDPRFVADRGKGIIAFTRWFGGIFARFAMDLVKLLRAIVIRFEVAICERPLGRDSIVMLKLLEIPFAQTKERRPV